MGRSFGRVVCILACIGVAPGTHSRCDAQFAPAFQANAQNESGFQSQADIDRDLVKAIERAKELIAAADYPSAVQLLQRAVIDRGSSPRIGEASEVSLDYFVDQKLEQSLKGVARRLIGELPPEGRKAYELSFGVLAGKLLEEAEQSRDPARLQAVARSYFHTEAGSLAAYALGAAYLDRGDPVAALLQFRQLLEYPDAARKFEPMLSLKSALCWAQTGRRAEAERMLHAARGFAENGRIVLGGRQVVFPGERDDAIAWLRGTFGGIEAASSAAVELDWKMAGGNPARTATGSDATPAWDSAWTHDVLSHPYYSAAKLQKVEQSLQRLTVERRRRNDLTIPAAAPLVVGNRVIFKTFGTVRVLDLHTGELVGLPAESLDPTFKQFLDRPELAEQQLGVNGEASSLLEIFLTRKAWHDLTAASVSTDGESIYSIEQLGLIGSPNYLGARVGRAGVLSMIANDYNTLTAFGLGGAMQWEAGGKKGGIELPLAGTFFLGPPLPLNGSLYCLGEVNQEIRLLVLDPNRRGQLLWSQSLILDNLGTLTSARRRQAGVSPSYGNGILVCPTLAGATIAIDLARRELLWGYRYTPDLPIDPNNGNPNRLWQIQNMGQMPDLESHSWIDSNPIIVGSSVVLTPRDSDELHCLDLLDGKLRWKRPREQWLYASSIGEGRLLLVGRTEVLAVNLANGENAWRSPASIELLAGRGVQVGAFYHISTATGELVTISLADGRIAARVPSRGGEELGTLVAAQGTLVSISTQRVSGFLPLAQLEATIARKLAANPQDAEAIALRGEIRLHRGEDAAALADLRAAIGEGGQKRARTLVASALLEGLRTDFARFRPHAAEIEQLVENPRQKWQFHRLYADGLHQIGENKAAFSEYVKLAGPETGEPRMDRVSALLAVRSDRWLRPRVGAIFGDASPPERAVMEQLLAGQLERAGAAADASALRKYIQCFAELPFADQARRALVDRLDPKKQPAEMEILLNTLRRSSDPAVSGFATARLARLLIELERGENVESLMRALSSQYADVVCLDGKTGGQLAQDWSADEEISKILGKRPVWPDREFEAKETVVNGAVERFYPIDLAGPRGMFPPGWSLHLSTARNEVIARDGDGTKRWQLSLQAMETERGRDLRAANFYGNYARVRGHLLVLSLGSYFVVVDTLAPGPAPRVLWFRSLLEGNAGVQLGSAIQLRQAIGPANQRKMVPLDRSGNAIGAVVPIGNDLVCYQVERTIYAADLLTGEILWERQSYPHGSEFYGDAAHVFVKPAGSNQIAVLRASDGEQVSLSPVKGVSSILSTNEGRLLGWVDGNAGTELALFDVLTGATLWSRKFAVGTLLDSIEDEEVALLTPESKRGETVVREGRLVVLRIDDGEAVVDSPAESSQSVSQLMVLRDQDIYTVLTYQPHEGPMNAQIIPIQNFPLVNGMAYGFDRATGRKLWSTVVSRQSIDPDQPLNLPVLVFGVQVFLHNGFAFSRGETRLAILDKRTGRLIFDEQTKDALHPMEIQAHPSQGRLDIRFARLTISLVMTDKPRAKG